MSFYLYIYYNICIFLGNLCWFLNICRIFLLFQKKKNIILYLVILLSEHEPRKNKKNTRKNKLSKHNNSRWKSLHHLFIYHRVFAFFFIYFCWCVIHGVEGRREALLIILSTVNTGLFVMLAAFFYEDFEDKMWEWDGECYLREKLFYGIRQVWLVWI